MMRASRNLVLLAAFFVIAGAAHFVIPLSYLAIVPRWVPYPLQMVYFTGAAEIVGGVALLLPGLRSTAGVCLIALLISVFPANIQMLGTAVSTNAPLFYQTILFFRLPLQPLLILWVYRAAIRSSVREIS
jgi:uncharacterized membrane protein